ncbi:MAG: hypothetical protein ABSB56_09280, partial [Nitrososphaerales archaeon]
YLPSVILQDALYRPFMQIQCCVHELGRGFSSPKPMRASHLSSLATGPIISKTAKARLEKELEL